MNTSLKRVCKQHPCPICEGIKWCSQSADGSIVICMRNQVGAIKETRNGGYLHRLKDVPYNGARVLHITPRTPPSPRFERMAVECFDALTHEGRAGLASSLGLSTESLVRLRTGWSAEHASFSFPMHNSSGGIVGIRLRRPNGYKFSVTGSRSGIFLPVDTPWSGTLLITEGPTDCAAMLDLGFACIGRPDALSCIGIVSELVRQRGYHDVVVVGDGDAPGQRGAESLASTLRTVSKNVRIIYPPPGIKDAREWKRQGATRAEIEDAINHAPYLPMTVKAVLCA